MWIKEFGGIVVRTIVWEFHGMCEQSYDDVFS